MHSSRLPHLSLLMDMERTSSDHRHHRHLEGKELLPSSLLLLRPPQTPTETMEFLARSWSLSASEVSRALGNVVLPPPPSLEKLPIAAATSHENSATTQTDRRTAEPSGRSPPISPRGYGELKLLRGVSSRGKTMVGWLRDIKEKRKEETRAHNAQVYAATSVAGVAVAVAGIAAGTVFAPQESMLQFGVASRTSAAAASAATLVASHCVEMARAMGATRGQISTVIQSAVSAQTTGDIMALTAGAATALRGAATLRARLCKDICGEAVTAESLESKGSTSAVRFVSKGGELLKRTRKGDLHWKQVSISMNSNWQVVLKMRSAHIATFAKTKKSKIDRGPELMNFVFQPHPLSGIIQVEWYVPGVVKEVCNNIGAWPGRKTGDRSNQRAYFGIRTPERLIEFECRNEYEKKAWTDGLQQILVCQANMKYCRNNVDSSMYCV